VLKVSALFTTIAYFKSKFAYKGLIAKVVRPGNESRNRNKLGRLYLVVPILTVW